MTNTEPTPTLAERLMSVPLGRLAVRLGLARTTLLYAQTAYQRAKAIGEIDAIKAEYARRGVPLASVDA